MFKLVLLVALGCWAARALTGQWPWQLWASSERSQAEAQARALLGVARDASRDQIGEAHRALLVKVHPDRGGTTDAVHAANSARDLLLARLNRIEDPTR